MRVFVAIEVPGETTQALGELIARVEKYCRGARWVRPEGMHITLKFVGDAATDTLERIKLSLQNVRLPAAVELRFRGIGFFPNAKHPRVFWAGIEASPNLAELVAATERALEPLGIPREVRPFKPHLTLARFESEDGLSHLLEALERLPPLEFGSTCATEFHLFRSVLKPSGAVYSRLESYLFAERAS